MRPKIVIALLLTGLAGVAVILFLKLAASRPQTAVVPAPITQPVVVLPKTITEALPIAPAKNVTTIATPSQPKKPAPGGTGAASNEAAAKIQAQIDRLVDLQSNDDDASLQAILKELANTNPIIRHEAIEATIQFGGRTAIPVLKELAARTWDPAEKKELLDAAEFLALPTLTEARAQKKLSESQGVVPPQ